ncbi:hypothetical protein BC834DRAFT_970895 [Gloeopeniophorella convolvens]|nr:hypothetical protein BC834DRAFT_970895 [Gloeopeniophorella convolvens]
MLSVHVWLVRVSDEDAGDVISVQVPGDVIVILNSHKAAKDLLEKRGDIYLDRPRIPFFEMMKWEWFLGLARYSDSWRAGRRFLDGGLRPAAALKYRPMQKEKTHLFLRQLLANPQDFRDHIEQCASSHKKLTSETLIHGRHQAFRMDS